MLISDLPEVASRIPRSIALLILAFFIVGFGTKAGLAPFHGWLPDAYAESPSPVSAVLSAVSSKVAIYALVRTLAIFFPMAAYHPVSMFVIALSAFTMLLGGLMCLAQDDLKRMVAYSSVSQMGYIAMGFGLLGIGVGTAAGNLGGYGGLFHLLTHVLTKAALFLVVGAIVYTTAARRMSELSGLARHMPVTAVTFFVAAFAISGLPPLNGFWSKLTLYFAAAKAELWWALGIAIVTSLLTLIAFVRAGYRVFWSDAGSDAGKAEYREAPAAMLVPMAVLSGLCVVIGLWPQMVYPLLNSALQALVRAF
jgi:formate hydrogenlyase subunit 3/multisubunit Na+/H+ antiporter MnhD subunit